MSSPVSSTAVGSFFTSERSAQILDHMNEDHAEAVLGYARHFAKRTDAKAARLDAIDGTGIDLVVSAPTGESRVRIDFEKPLTSPDDAHLALVGMAREVKQAAENAAEAAIARARAALAQLGGGLRTAILGTASGAGEPDASVAPVVRSADGSLHTYVSEMSVHTKNLRESARASLLIIEDEASAAHLLARKRLTLRCDAEFVERDTPVFTAVIAELTKTFGPVMEHLAGMVDFHVVKLTPRSGRLVAGFGKAFDVDPLDWNKVSHVGGEGAGHVARK